MEPTQGSAPTPRSNAADKKLAAGLTGILLGALGVHKFILGYQREGIIMLVVSLVGSIPTCGAAAGVVGTIGLVEGIIYFSKSDAEFEEMYLVGRKPWF